MYPGKDYLEVSNFDIMVAIGKFRKGYNPELNLPAFLVLSAKVSR